MASSKILQSERTTNANGFIATTSVEMAEGEEPGLEEFPSRTDFVQLHRGKVVRAQEPGGEPEDGQAH